MCVRNGRSGLAAQRLSDFRVGVADWVDEHTLLRRVRRADEAERKDELGTDQVAVPERVFSQVGVSCFVTNFFRFSA